MPVNRVLGPVLLSVCACGPSWAQKPRTAPDPALVALKARLHTLLQRDQPKATVAIQSEPGDNATLHAEYQTQTFLVYSRAMTGQISAKPYAQVGPNYQGFRLELSVQPGPYAGQAVVPQDLREPYWQTYIDAVPLKGGNQYLAVRLSYGEQTNSRLLDKLKRIAHTP